ncbi:hypothetical protein DAPPUDRAFT_248801 [Daphnia pulex]|uniref:Uncharacterized protein n=1 Tax=Daphnia pulex TaxID=6669 RepID=E9GV91_DAPPU|nr:hypothetical protein DAPPUDRAFT_248801 [Daphnia pulex]|eukprot:EFX76621.1 hypothetical protein DAPPUDRAFT_248801 [Daphnia pulex]
MTDADWAACQITTNAVESQNKKGTSKTKSFRDVLNAATESDANVGKTVYIDTYGARGKKYGWCEAIIMKKTEKGYTARYVTDKKTTFIPNINDEKIRFFPCEEQEA